MLFSPHHPPRRSVALLILDGWGDAPAWGGNAITTATTPVFDGLYHTAASTTLQAAGTAVGLPAGEPGNSEVGHLTIGAGRCIEQDRTRISRAIDDGEFFRNQVLRQTMERARATGRTLHLIGLISPGGVHSHMDHLRALLELAHNLQLTKVAIHAITDGRDALPQAAAQALDQVRHWCTEFGVGTIASIVGRALAMDRDHHWNRTKLAYELFTSGAGSRASSALAGISAAYAAGTTDEFIQPVWIDQPLSPIGAGDSVILWNFRPDRMRELASALADPAFSGFRRQPIPDLTTVTFTQYWAEATTAAVAVAFPPVSIDDSLGALVSASGLQQLRIAESEKYAHVTYFLNGGREQPFPGEDRHLIDSKLTGSPADKPQMQTYAIAHAVVKALHANRYGLIVANFAAPDMVGHTGNLQATATACELVDQAIGTIVAAAADVQVPVVITADHGNAEQLIDPTTNEADTHHTKNPVPLILTGIPATARLVSRPSQTLADVAPTVLTLLGLAVPHSMAGQTLVTLAPYA